MGWETQPLPCDVARCGLTNPQHRGIIPCFLKQVLKVLSESSEDIGFLRSLRDSYNNRLAFAHKEDAAWVSLEEIVETTAGSQTVCEVRFSIDSNSNYDFFDNTL